VIGIDWRGDAPEVSRT